MSKKHSETREAIRERARKRAAARAAARAEARNRPTRRHGRKAQAASGNAGDAGKTQTTGSSAAGGSKAQAASKTTSANNPTGSAANSATNRSTSSTKRANSRGSNASSARSGVSSAKQHSSSDARARIRARVEARKAAHAKSSGVPDIVSTAGTTASNLVESANDVKPAHRIIIGVIIAVVVVSLMFGVANQIHKMRTASDGFPAAVEQWRPAVETACKDAGLDTKWVDTVLAMMQVESGGDASVGSVVGAGEDVMQAGEGCAGVNAGSKSVIALGASGLAAWDITPSQPVYANTATASIYAGVIETKLTVEMFEGWLGPINVNNADVVALIAQGYNYGPDGWFQYCYANGITAWTYEASLSYQYSHGGGTADHGQKVIDAYVAARTNANTSTGDS